MNVFWMHGRPNFGDMLTPEILTYFNIKHSMTTKIDRAQAMSTGSIIQRARDNMLVLGSGMMFSTHKINPNANYKFVRGPLTREKIIQAGGQCPKIYGDPGLLLPLFCEESKKEYDVGIVPHYVDFELAKQKYPGYKIIDVLNNDPKLVAKEITQCRSIISSSLHGIIAAHAYNIPAAWVRFSKKVKGDGIKFQDHYLSIGLTAEMSTVEKPKFTVGKFDTSQIIEIFQNL